MAETILEVPSNVNLNAGFKQIFVLGTIAFFFKYRARLGHGRLSTTSYLLQFLATLVFLLTHPFPFLNLFAQTR